MRYYKNGKILVATMRETALEEITEEQYKAEMAEVEKRQNMQAELFEKSRPFTAEEVSRMVIAQQINTLSVDDNTALRMVEFYPEWAENTAYSAGFKVQYDGKLWRCLTAHTSIATWYPSTATASLWETINETHAGTQDAPIPYDGNMALENGKYYMQDYVIYLCIRDTGNAVYNALAELVGLYVEAV